MEFKKETVRFVFKKRKRKYTLKEAIAKHQCNICFNKRQKKPQLDALITIAVQ